MVLLILYILQIIKEGFSYSSSIIIAFALSPSGAEMQHRKVRWRFCAFVIPLPRLRPGGVFTGLHFVT